MRTAIKVILITLGSLNFVVEDRGVGYWWWQKNGEKMIADIKATEVDGANLRWVRKAQPALIKRRLAQERRDLLNP